MPKKVTVVTIDGPAGGGKSTVSARLAQKLNFQFLTTGAFYRGLALMSIKYKTENPADLVKFATSPHFVVDASVQGTTVFIDGDDVTERLHDEKTAQVASRISAIAEVREALLVPQRKFVKPPGLVAEGRDCGTVVFPEAQIKIFLTASLDARAQRRHTVEAKESLASRDHADSSRKAAPMVAAKDAVIIDTSTMSIEEVVEQIELAVRQKL